MAATTPPDAPFDQPAPMGRTPVLPAAPVLAAVLGGVTSLVLGILILVWPEATLKVGAVLFGIQLVIVGAVRAVLGAFASALDAWVRAIYVLTGLLVVIAGIVCIRHPVLTIAVIVLTIAIGWLVDGVALIVAGANATSGRWPAVVVGGVTVVAAIVLLAWPVESTSFLLSLGGWLLVLIGLVSMIGVPWAMRESRRTPDLA